MVGFIVLKKESTYICATCRKCMNAMKNYTYHLVAVLTVGIWGLTFISTKVLIGHGLSPQEIFLLRFLIAYMGIWLISPRKLFADNWKDEFWMFLGGITGGSFYFFTENIENQTEYEFWNGSGWIKGNETAATPLFNDISGELSIAYHPEFKKWILLYFNSTRYDISFRTADHIIGEWSKPQKLVDGWQYSQLYGSYIHPISLKGNILYFIMSMWLPYNTYLMSAELKCNP